jgi:hypothetical protein
MEKQNAPKRCRKETPAIMIEKTKRVVQKDEVTIQFAGTPSVWGYPGFVDISGTARMSQPISSKPVRQIPVLHGMAHL